MIGKISKTIAFILLMYTILVPLLTLAAATELFSTPLFSSANLVSYYRLSDVSDSKGSNTLTNVNSVTFTAGQFGNAATGPFTIIGTNGTALTISTTPFTATDNFSWNIWVKLSAVGTGENAIIINGDLAVGNGYGFELFANPANSFALRWAAFPFTSWTTVTSGIVSGTHMITMIRNSGTIRFYLDGTDTGFTSTTAISAATGPLVLANGFWSGAYQYNDDQLLQFDDVSYLNRPLTPTEISELFNGFPASGFYPSYEF